MPPRGESYRILSERVADWLGGIVRPTLTVSHGGVGRVLRARVLGLDPLAAIATPFPQDRVLLFEGGRESWV